MHRLRQSENLPGSFEKLAIDADTQVYEQMKLVFIASNGAILESLLAKFFVQELKAILSTSFRH